MKIGINALFRFKPTGVANYICNLVCNLSRIDQKNEYFVVTTPDNRQYFPIEQENFKFIYCSLNSISPIYRRIWEQTVLPKLIKSYNIDLLHCPMNVLPLISKCKKIVTIIDTQYFLNPEHFSFLRRNYLKIMIRLSLNRANGIITISESVKKEIKKHLAQNNNKEIRVAHLGIGSWFKIIDNDNIINEVKIKYGIHGKYLLFIGYPHYRKNLVRLIISFKKVLDLLPDPYTLVIAGEMGTDDSDIKNIQKTIRKYNMKERVLFTGYVSGNYKGEEMEEQNIVILINGAELFVYPSLYEGFGLPVLEAMSCSTPVLTSDIPVLREIAGDAAIFVNPYKIEDIAEGIYNGLTDDLLRKKIILRGIERVKIFNWKTTAKKTLEYYEEIFDRIKDNS